MLLPSNSCIETSNSSLFPGPQSVRITLTTRQEIQQRCVRLSLGKVRETAEEKFPTAGSMTSQSYLVFFGRKCQLNVCVTLIWFTHMQQCFTHSSVWETPISEMWRNIIEEQLEKSQACEVVTIKMNKKADAVSCNEPA